MNGNEIIKEKHEVLKGEEGNEDMRKMVIDWDSLLYKDLLVLKWEEVYTSYMRFNLECYRQKKKKKSNIQIKIKKCIIRENNIFEFIFFLTTVLFQKRPLARCYDPKTKGTKKPQHTNLTKKNETEDVCVIATA